MSKIRKKCKNKENEEFPKFEQIDEKRKRGGKKKLFCLIEKH